MDAYESARAALLACSSFEHGVGATPQQLDEAQRELGAFPGDYLQFVREFGYASFKSYEVWGVSVIMPRGFDLVSMNRTEHEEFGLPNELIAFHNNGGGDLTGFKRDSPSALELWTYWHEDQTLAADGLGFGGFVLNRLKD